MKEKIWIINDGDSDFGMGRRPPTTPRSRQRGAVTTKVENTVVGSSSAVPVEKSPALSFSLSMLLCGSGYLYLGQYRLGALFLAVEMFFVVAFTNVFYFWGAIKNFSVEHIFEAPLFVFTGLALVQFALFLWLGGAVDAYRRALKDLSETYSGVDRDILPLVANLFFPGWGQFLNGQPKKGTIYLLFGLVGLFSVFIMCAARPVWPLIAFSPGNTVFEVILLAAILFAPVALMAWIISVYDIFRTRIGEQLHSHLPRLSTVLALLLAISVGLHFISGQYYLDLLDSVRLDMAQRNMSILPQVLENALNLFSRLTGMHIH